MQFSLFKKRNFEQSAQYHSNHQHYQVRANHMVDHKLSTFQKCLRQLKIKLFSRKMGLFSVLPNSFKSPELIKISNIKIWLLVLSCISKVIETTSVIASFWMKNWLNGTNSSKIICYASFLSVLFGVCKGKPNEREQVIETILIIGWYDGFSSPQVHPFIFVVVCYHLDDHPKIIVSARLVPKLMIWGQPKNWLIFEMHRFDWLRVPPGYQFENPSNSCSHALIWTQN